MKSSGKAELPYIGAVTALGIGVIALSLYRLFQEGVSYQWLILAYLTVLTGAFTIRIPGVNSKFSVSDTFVFINTLLFGTAAGALTGALDGLVGSVRSKTSSRRKHTIPFNTAVLGLSAFAAGEVFFGAHGSGPLSQAGSVSLPALALPLLLAVGAFYMVNSTLVAGMLALVSGGNPVHMWRQGVLRTFAITLAGAAAGAIIAFSVQSITPLTLLIVVPILVTIYFVNMVCLGSRDEDSAPADASRLCVVHRPAYRRFHYFMVALGLGFVALLVQNVFSESASFQWMWIALLAMLAGFITVKIPDVKIKFSIADTFVFANIILFGPIVGGITAALDGLAGSLRTRSRARRMEFTLFNIAGMALSAYVAGELFFKVLGHGPLYLNETVGMGATFLPALLLAISYYLLNTMVVAVIVALQARQSAWRVWCDNLLWGMTSDIACGLGAVFVAAAMLAVTPMISVSVLLIMITVYMSLKAGVERVPQRSLRPQTR